MDRSKINSTFATCRFTILFIVSPALLAPLRAHAEGDVWLSIGPTNQKATVGVVDEAATVYTPGVRLFSTILLPDALPFSSFDFSSEEPGFRAAPGELPPSQAISLDFESPASWNGSALEPAAGVAFAFATPTLTVEPTGALHDHSLFGLLDLTLDPLPLPDGVYVAFVRASIPGYAPSDPFALVMLKDDLVANEDDAAALDALLEAYEIGGPAPIFGGKDFSFVSAAQDAVAAIAPEPTTTTLTIVAAVASGLYRRRRFVCRR